MAFHNICAAVQRYLLSSKVNAFAGILIRSLGILFWLIKTKISKNYFN